MLKLRKKRGLDHYTLFDYVVNLLVIILTIVIAYPIYFCLIASFSDPDAVATGQTLLWFKGFTLDAYTLVLEHKEIWGGYRNTIIYTLFGTLYNVSLTLMAAYPLSKKGLPFAGVISWFFFLTMYVNGGLIPNYLLRLNLGLVGNPLVLILGNGVGAYNMIVCRQFFSTSIPNDVYEAAYIDGATETQTFLRIAMPLSKPIIAVMSLYNGVAIWNDWFSANIYIRKPDYYPLQLVLRNILINNQLQIDLTSEHTEILEYSIMMMQMMKVMKYSVMIVAVLPLIIAYPFVQKYFVKGAMIGSVKG